MFFKYGAGLPDYQQLASYEPPIVTRLYANDGRLFAEYAYEKRVFVPIEVIPQRIIKTFLAAEDKNFYSHFGVDIGGIIRAAIMNIQRARDNRRPVGASTITQQVAKNFLLNEISREVSLTRKIKEAILSFRIELTYSKDHILELYLNEIYLGSGSYGVAAAALNYFNKSLNELTIAEAAFLAGLPKAPSRYHPRRSPQLAKQRRDYVIKRMLDESIITRAEAVEAVAQPITLRKRDETEVVQANYFAEDVRRDLLAQYGENVLYEGGLTVRTTLDPKLQELAEKTLRQGLIDYDRRHGWRGPVTRVALKSANDIEAWIGQLKAVPLPAGIGSWQLAIVLSLGAKEAKIGLRDASTGAIPLSELKWAKKYISAKYKGPAIAHPKGVLRVGDVVLVDAVDAKQAKFKLHQIPKISGAMVVMEPHTGRVLAMTGGYSFDLSQYNRATQAYRQPGSAFKSFVYLAALEKGLTPSTILRGGPIAIDMGYGLGIWKPTNYEDKFFGPSTLRVAFEKSRNVMTVRLVQEKVGIVNVIDVAKRLGVVEEMPKQLAMVLGAGETTLMKLTAGYAMLANGGKKVIPSLVERIQDRKGKTLWKRDALVCEGCTHERWMNQPIPKLIDTSEQMVDPQVAYQMVSLMEGVIKHGTGRTVRRIMDRDVPLAGKTGTTNEFNDAWFVGFSPNLAVGIYLGFDGPSSLGPKQGGGVLASPLFANFMKEALADQPAIPFRIPPGIRLVRVDRMTGLKATSDSKNVIVEAFRRGDKIPTADDQDDEDQIDDLLVRGSGGGAAVTGTGGIY